MNMETVKTALVTGSAGFLGSHLCEHLLKMGYHVIGVDNLCTGSKANREDIFAFAKDRFLFFEKDVTLPWTWAKDIPKNWTHHLKYIFHFASPASPPLYQKLNIETMHVNSVGLENAIHFANTQKAKVVFASTSEIYGDPLITPQQESYWGNVNSFGIRSCYDEAKRFGESLIFSYNQRFHTRHGFVRIFNTYGPRMNPMDGRVVINFLVQALKGECLTIYGDGRQTRSFCYVEDLVSGIIQYALRDINKPINLGNPTEFTILELAKMVQKMFSEKNLKIVHLELPQDDPKKRRPDISQAQNLLAPWHPKVSLEQGLQHMLNWLQSEKIF